MLNNKMTQYRRDKINIKKTHNTLYYDLFSSYNNKIWYFRVTIIIHFSNKFKLFFIRTRNWCND